MVTVGFDEQIELIVKQLIEKINTAISFALDESKSFEQAELIFNEAITVLVYYQCGDTAAEQLINFSKIAYFRKEKLCCLRLMQSKKVHRRKCEIKL